MYVLVIQGVLALALVLVPRIYPPPHCWKIILVSSVGVHICVICVTLSNHPSPSVTNIVFCEDVCLLVTS